MNDGGLHLGVGAGKCLLGDPCVSGRYQCAEHGGDGRGRKNALAGWLDGVRHNFPLLLVRFGDAHAQPPQQLAVVLRVNALQQSLHRDCDDIFLPLIFKLDDREILAVLRTDKLRKRYCGIISPPR
jgi:hypothetical protein